MDCGEMGLYLYDMEGLEDGLDGMPRCSEGATKSHTN